MRAKRPMIIAALLAMACRPASGDPGSAGAAPTSNAMDGASQPDPSPAAGQPWRNSLGMEFVPVPGVNVLFSRWETRVQDYAAFARREGRKWPKPNFEQGPTHPAVNVTWDDANAFCGWLTERERKVGFLPAGWRYRLPKDLEWSAAVGGLGVETGKTPFARSGEIKGVYPWGGPWPPPTGAGNYAPSRETDSHEFTAPVGSFPTNRYGMCDLGGNVWEWCEEIYQPGKGARTLRGGSWFNSTPWHLASSGRDKAGGGSDDIRIGFRVVLELPAR